MVRFGILGAGNIARRFAASLSHVQGASLGAVSCRTQEKADAAAAQLGAERAYAGHAALLEDETLDAIYLALPHDLHHPWAIRALEAGKAVLCEKPAMLSAAQMREVANVAREKNVLFMEAMKPRFVPLYPAVLQAIDELGAITHVEATLCNDMLGSVEGTGSYHMTPGPGAGVLLDCGTYCASWIEALCLGTPSCVSATGSSKQGIDTYIDALLHFENADARLECAFDRGKPRTATIQGTKGHLVVDELHRPQHATLYLDDTPPREINAPYVVDDFYGEICHFVELVTAGAHESPVMPPDASIRCAQILDTVRSAFTTTESLRPDLCP